MRYGQDQGSAYDSHQYIFALLEAGAAGYLLKNVRGSELVDALRAVQCRLRNVLQVSRGWFAHRGCALWAQDGVARPAERA